MAGRSEALKIWICQVPGLINTWVFLPKVLECSVGAFQRDTVL